MSPATPTGREALWMPWTIPSAHTVSTTLFSIPTTHHICPTTTRDETRGMSSLAKLNEPSRSQLHSDAFLRDATLLAHLHAPFLSTYDVPEPTCKIRELRKTNHARTKISENAEGTENQDGLVHILL